MKKRKINVNRPQISSEEIAAGKDFASLMQDYRKVGGKSIFQKPGYMASFLAAAASIVGLVAYLYWSAPEPSEMNTTPTVAENKADATPQAEAVSPTFMEPPMAGLDVPKTHYEVSSEEGSVLEYPTGSKITIPPTAFVDENGKTVNGKVEVRYREFHDQVDMFVSGIPMTYDSAGTTYQLESAGMMEIEAFQDGEPVYIHPGRQIEVELASDRDSREYNLYRLDTINENWECLGKEKEIKTADEAANPNALAQNDLSATNTTQMKGRPEPPLIIEAMPAMESPKVLKAQQSLELAKKEVENVRLQAPLAPRQANPNRYRFNLDVDPEEFPEISTFKNLRFEVGPENTDFTADMYNVVWEDARLSEVEAGVKYQLELAKAAQRYQFIVYPVLEGKDFEAAKAKFDREFAKYQQRLNKRIADEKEKEEQYAALVAKAQKERAEWEAKMEARKKAAEEARKQFQIEQAKRQANEREASQKIKYYNFRRVFAIDKFGVWNSDCARKPQHDIQLSVDFKDENGKNLKVDIAYHIDKSVNTLYCHYSGAFNKFSYKSGSENVLFAVVGNNKLAVYRVEDFAAIEKKSGKFIMELKRSDRSFETIDEIKAYLNV